jgi:solute carrier family 26 protein
VIVSVISILLLYIVKVHINERFKHKLPVPIPIELIVVAVGTTVSYFMKFKEEYKIKIIGYLPLGYCLTKIK